MTSKAPGPFRAVLLLLACALWVAPLRAQGRDEVINGSFLVAFGRFANGTELGYWRQHLGNRSIPQLVAEHQQRLDANPIEREQVVRRSFLDAFGWSPAADELRYWSGQKKNYAALLSHHLSNGLAVYRERRELVIRLSYRKVFRRAPSPRELKYWMEQPPYSFVQLVATHSTWKGQRQRHSGLTRVQANLQRDGISTAPLSAGAVQGVLAAGGAPVLAPGGAPVLTAGGSNAVTATVQ